MYWLAKIVENCVENQDRAGQAHYGQRLAGEEAVQDSNDEPWHEGLNGRDPVLSGIAKEASECDERREASEVDEDHGGDALQGEGVLEVWPVVRFLPLDVVDQASERPT